MGLDQFEGTLFGGETIGDTSVPIMSDLALGAWRGHQVAAEFADQLGVSLPLRHPRLPKHERRDERVASDLLDEVVDAEARGSLSAIASLDAATAIASAVVGGPARSFFVMLPIFGEPVGTTNLRFLEFLAEGLEEVGGHITIVRGSGELDFLPESWELSSAPSTTIYAPVAHVDARWGFVPGLVPPGSARDPDDEIPVVVLANGYGLVLPSTRTHPKTLPATRPMTALEGAPPWVVAYQEARGLLPHSEMRHLGDYAWDSFRVGDLDLGRRMLERGTEVARFPSPQGDLLVSLLAMRVGSHRYRDASEDDRRPRAVPPAMVDQWLRSKAYAAALDGDGATAAAWFSEATQPGSSDRLTDAGLYALNLLALIKFRQGDDQGALALQESIESNLATQANKNWHLLYLNAINLARLHRAGKRYDAADEWYQRAFAVTDGTRVENDLIYTNVCLARNADDRGDRNEAMRCWTRAGLHFAANSVPEALGWRCATAILQRRVDAEENLTDEVADRLAHHLGAIVHNADLRDGPAPTFAYTRAVGASPTSGPAIGALGDGWAVFLRSGTCGVPYDSDAHRRLRRTLWSVIRTQARLTDDVRPGTVQVDAQHGRELPRSQSEVLDVAARIRTSRVIIAGSEIATPIPLLAEWERTSTISLGPAVADIARGDGETIVKFRRQLPPIALTAELTATLDEAVTSRSVSALQERAQLPRMLDRLRELEANRVLCLNGPNAELSLTDT